MKNIIQGLNSRVDEAEDQINDLEDKEAENTLPENKKNPKEGEKVREPLGQL